MANNIKGITVEIGGNVGPLKTALKDVDKTAGNLQSQLKEVNKQLKFDPSNTTLLKQKQELLTKEISNTSEKLKTLKAAEKQAQEQFAQGKISQEQYQALQREVIKTESQLKELGRQAGLANAALDKVSVVTGKIGTSATALGKGLMPVTAAVTAAGAAAVAAYVDVDKGADTVIEKTGATGEAAKEMKSVYQDVAASVPDSMQDVGNAVGEINTRLEFTGDKLETASDDFLKFAKINGTDVNTSVQLVSRAMGDAGIKSDDYKAVLDQLTVAGQKSGISIDTLTTNLAKYGAPMRALGLDTKTSIAMFAGWEKAGVNTEIAFSGMKKAISTWGAQGKDSRVEFKKTLEEIKNAPDIAAATTKAIEVFGQKAGPDLADAIQGGRFEVQDYIDALENSQGAVESTYAGIADGTDDAKTAMNAAKVAASELGGTILEALAPVLQKVASAAKKAADMFGSMDEKTRKTILTVAGIAAAVAPALLIAGKIANGISNITKAMTIARTATLAETAAQTSWTAALLTSPVTWIVVGIAALIAALVLLYKNCKPFHDWVVKALNTVKNLAKTVFNGLITFFTSTIPKAWNSLVSFFKGVPSWWSKLWTQVGQFFKNFWSGIKSVVMAIITPFITEIKNIFNGMKSGLSDILNGVKSIFSGVWTIIKNVVLGIVLLIIDLVTGNFKKLHSDLSGILNNIKNAFKTIWSGIKSVAVGIVKALTGAIIAIFKNMVTDLKLLGNKLKTFFSGLWTGIKKTAVSIWNGLIKFIQGLPSEFSSAVKSIGQAIIHGFDDAIVFIKGLPAQMLQWGKDMIQGLVDGIESMIGRVTDAVKNVASKITSFLHFSKPDEGPLADYESWMPDMMDGIRQGILSSMSKVQDAVQQVSMVIAASIPTDLAGDVQARTAYAAAYGRSSVAASAQQTAVSASAAPAPMFQQTVNNYSPKALSPAESARLTRNATRQFIRSLKG
ncbi:MAG: phage tail tape measure protein [Oscillospiraceae bacterium]|nr:phage tail tape measure protein [Oscillospiraceae bacterium]